MHTFEELIKEEEKIKEIIKNILFLAKKRTDNIEVNINVLKRSSLSFRNKTFENFQFCSTKLLVIKVYDQYRKGCVSSTDFSLSSIKTMIDKAILLSKYTSVDSCSGLPDQALLAFNMPFIDLCFFSNFDIKDVIEMTSLVESSAYEFDKRIINTEGTCFCSDFNVIGIGNSLGLLQTYKTTDYFLSTGIIAKDNKNNMQCAFNSTLARKVNNLEKPELFGIKTARYAIKKLSPKKISTIKLPVVFISDVSSSLFLSFSDAINGENIYQKSSFLSNSLGKQIFPTWLNIIEEPHLDGGIASKPFDNEGVLTKQRTVVNKGVLKSWKLNSYTARKLGLKTTGNAGGIHNWLVSYDKVYDFKKLLRFMYKGIVVTDLMGQGVNIITGDYSRGMSGFFVDKGKIQYPLHEMTISGNLKRMFLDIIKISNDINNNEVVKCGSVLISQMQISGK